MDKLFLLKPGFTDDKIDNEGRRYYCPSCAAIEGMLHYHPELRTQLEIVYVNFEKPRQAIAEILGEDHQSCPVLVLDAKEQDLPDNTVIKYFGQYRFVQSSIEIMKYLAYKYSVYFPHP